MVSFQSFIIDPEYPMGMYIHVYEAEAKDSRIKERGKAGGAVTAILLYLLEEKIVDTIIVARKKHGLRGETYVVKTPEEILEAVGSIWSVVPYTLGLKEKLLSPEVKKSVFVGLPCQAQFLRQMKMFPLLESDFSSKIYLIISLFCMGTFAIESFLSYVHTSYRVSPDDITSVEIVKDKLLIKHVKGELTISVDEVLPYLQHGCLTCPDYTGVFADISAGRSPESESTLLISRNKMADKIIRDAASKGYIGIREASVKVIDNAIEKSREKILRSYKYVSTLI